MKISVLKAMNPQDTDTLYKSLCLLSSSMLHKEPESTLEDEEVSNLYSELIKYNKMTQTAELVYDSSLFKYYFSQILSKTPAVQSQETLSNLSVQLLKLSIALTSSSNAVYLNNFFSTGPSIWLIPVLSNLFLETGFIKVKYSILTLLTSLLKIYDTETTQKYNKELIGVFDTLLCWNGIVYNTLQTLSSYADQDMFIEYTEISLELIYNLLETVDKQDSVYFNDIMSGLLGLLEDTRYPVFIVLKAIRLVNTLVLQNINVFKEMNGIGTCVLLFNTHVHNHDAWETRSEVIKTIFNITTKVLSKWDTLQTVSHAEIRIILENGILPALNLIFLKKTFEIYEEILELLNRMIVDYVGILNQFIANGIIINLFQSLETRVPLNPSLIDKLLRLMCTIGYNSDGAILLESYNTITNAIFALGNSKDSDFTNNIAVSIGETLSELVCVIPNTVDRAVSGCVSLLIFLKSSDFNNPTLFFFQIRNLGKLFKLTFTFTPEVATKLLNQMFFDDILDLIKLPVYSIGPINEFHVLSVILKSIPVSLSSNILLKILQSLAQQLLKVEDIVGSLYNIVNISPNKLQLLCTISSIDSHVEFLRVMMLKSCAVSSYYQEITEVMMKITHLVKFLIIEKIEITCLSMPLDRAYEPNHPANLTELENISIDTVKVFENNVIKLFKAVIQLTTKSKILESAYAGCIIKNLGDMLSLILKPLDLSYDYKKIYTVCNQISFILRVLFTRHQATVPIMYSFCISGGIESILKLLKNLKIISNEIDNKCSYHVYNSLQILWFYTGKFFEYLMKNKYHRYRGDYKTANQLGSCCPDDFVRQLRIVVYYRLRSLNLVQCPGFSQELANSDSRIVKSFLVDFKEFKDSAELGEANWKDYKSIDFEGFSTKDFKTQGYFDEFIEKKGFKHYIIPFMYELSLENNDFVYCHKDTLQRLLPSEMEPCITTTNSFIKFFINTLGSHEHPNTLKNKHYSTLSHQKSTAKGIILTFLNQLLCENLTPTWYKDAECISNLKILSEVLVHLIKYQQSSYTLTPWDLHPFTKLYKAIDYMSISENSYVLLDMILQPLELLTSSNLYNASNFDSQNIEEAQSSHLNCQEFQREDSQLSQESVQNFEEVSSEGGGSPESFSSSHSTEKDDQDTDDNLSLNDLNELSFQDFNEKINIKPSLEPFSETQDLAFPDFSSKSKVLNKLYLEILDLFQDIPKKEEYSSDTEDQMSINVYFDKTEKKNSDSNTPENLFTEETPDEIKDETLNFNHPEKKILEPIEEHLYNPIYIDEKLKQSLEEFSNPRNIFGSIEEEDSFIQKLLDCYYLLKPVNINTLVLLFLNLSKSDVLCSKILSGLLYILVSDEYFFIAFPGVFNHAKAVSALRAIETLHHMVSLSTKVCIQLSTFFEIQLSIIKKLHPQQKTGLSMLLGLFSHNLYKKSYLHLAALLKLISNLIGKLGVKMPALKQKHFNWICKLLRLENINDACIKEITDLILKLFKLSHCKETLIKALNQQIIEIGKEIEGCLTKPLVTTSGLKEIQLLRLCKILKSISGCIEEIDFLWYPLTVKLSNIQLKDSNFIHCTNSLLKTLLPLIESFFISHYDRPNSPSFQYFSENNHKVINMLIKKNPSLLSTTFNLLILRLPSLLDFENKRNYFRAEMREVQRDSGDDTIRLHVRRQEVFMDSYHQLKVKTGAEMYGKLRIQFVGEEGLDAGGLTREWYGLLARAMFNPNYALFIPSANGVSFQPNSMSSINTEHIQFFKFVGRIIGKALCDGYALDLYFTRSFYKHILSQQVNYQDMEDLDIDFYKSLKSLMNINLNESELHEYYFAYEEEEFGKHKIKELVPEGKTKRVTEENKIDYIKLLCHMKMTKNIQAQIDAFKTGFHELVPADLISIFDSKELELLISGLPNIDLEDLQANTDYYNYTKDSQVILWLWEVLYEFSHEERAEFLQFVTGSSKVPLEGFKALPGLGGLQKFQIHKSFTSHDRLPTAHTCMNQLDLPEYPSKEKLKNRLKLAISEGKEGFGFI